MPQPVTHWPHTEDSSLVLQPGESASITFEWTTVPTIAGQPCITVKWLSGPMLIDAPALLPPLCSDILSGPLTADSSPSVPTPQTLELSSAKPTFLAKERIPLQARHDSLGPSLPAEPALAPYDAGGHHDALLDFYLLSRSPDGDTRFDPAYAQVRPCFGTHPPATTGQDGLPCVRFDSHWGSTGVHELIAVRAVAQTEGVVLSRSNVLAVTVLAPETLVRTWGPRLAGVAVALDLDKPTYTQGEDIPLHIALENFAATTPVHSWSPLWDPGIATNLTVLDAQGKALPQGEGCFHLYTGHGFGPNMPVLLGTPIYIEDACASAFLQPPLPPGLYTFVVTWDSLVGSPPVPVRVQARAAVDIVP